MKAPYRLGSGLAVLSVAVVVVLPAVGQAAPRKPLSGTAIGAKLNAERGRLGLGGVEVRADLSAHCASHNRWMQINRRVQHEEIPGTRGYSERGNWAGTGSVLAGPGEGWLRGNPWLNAPLHLAAAFDPLLRLVGASDAYSHSCLTIGGLDFTRVMLPFGTPLTDHVATFPTDGGTAPFGQLAREVPYIPQVKVGLRSTQKTGPYLYVLAYTDLWQAQGGDRVLNHDAVTGMPIIAPVETDRRPLGRLVSGSLTGPGGRDVPIKVIDAVHAPDLLNEGSGWLLPIRPLKPATTYRATVVLGAGRGTAHWKAPDREITHSWTFKTDRRALGYTPERCRGRACRPWTWP